MVFPLTGGPCERSSSFPGATQVKRRAKNSGVEGGLSVCDELGKFGLARVFSHATAVPGKSAIRCSATGGTPAEDP